MNTKQLIDMLEECKNAAHHALEQTEPFAGELRRILGDYHSILEEIDIDVKDADSESVREIASVFNQKLGEVREVMIALTRECRAELDKSLQALEANADYVTVVLFGRTRTGKSTTMEALTGGDGNSIGIGKQHTTTEIREYYWPPGQSTMRIIDTPGIEGYRGDELAKMAEKYVEQADHIFFLLSDDKAGTGELEAFANIRSLGKGLTVLLNMKQGDEDLDLLLDMPEFLFNEKEIDGHRRRISGYLQRHHGIDEPVILPFHARAAWLATREKDLQRARELRQISRISMVEQRIFEFVKEQALGARIESPRQVIDSYLVSIKDELRVFAGEFRSAQEETRKRKTMIESGIGHARSRSGRRLSAMKSPFQAASDQIPILIDGLISRNADGNALSAEWEELLRQTGVDNAHERFIDDVIGIFTEELEEQVKQFRFDATVATGPKDTQKHFDEINSLRDGAKYRRAGRAGIKAAATFGTTALTAWAISNAWNPTGWVAGAAVLASVASGIAAGAGAEQINKQWRKTDQRKLQKQRNQIVRKITDSLWDRYRSTNDSCYQWLQDFRASLSDEIAVTLGVIHGFQHDLWRGAVETMDQLDALHDQMSIQMISELAGIAVPEIGSGGIEVVRVERWHGKTTKVMVSGTDKVRDNVIGRCIGRGGSRSQVLRRLLGGEWVSWVEAGVDLRTQVAQALSPARVLAGDVRVGNFSSGEITVDVTDDQYGFTVGSGGSNVFAATKLLGLSRISVQTKK